MTLEEYFVRFAQYKRENPYKRTGQAMYNVLTQMEPQLAAEIFAVDSVVPDPYYDDALVGDFITWLIERLGVTVTHTPVERCNGCLSCGDNCRVEDGGW
jgi:hypothetical protein